MNATANKQLIAEYIHAINGKPKPLALLQRYVADQGLLDHISQCEAAFPNYEIVVHRILADNDLVAVHGTFRGTHRGASFFGVEPRGRHASAELMIIYRVENGRISAHWLQFDGAALVAQLQNAVA